MESYEEQIKKDKVESAKVELTEAEAIKILLKNNIIACEIHISGMVIGICDNKKLLPIIEYQIKEIEKFLNGEKNQWE